MGTHAQPGPEGKTYTATISSACKEFRDGCCMIYTHCRLSFQKEKVTVSYFVTASCTPESREKNYAGEQPERTKVYAWSESGNTVVIEGFGEYGTYSFKNGRLYGKKNETQELEFAPVSSK